MCLLVLLCAHVNAEILSFENVNVIPMSEERVLKDQRVIVDGDRIVAIEPMSMESHIKPTHRIDCQHKYLMPGFTDVHFHPRGANNERELQLFYKLLLANGITTVVSMGEDPGQDAIAIKQYANKKEVIAPVYFTAGPFLGSDNLRSPQEALEMVRLHQQRGYDFIKIHEDVAKDTYLALLAEAEKEGIPVVGHAQRNLPLEYTLRLTLIAHMEEVAMVFADNQNFIIPELSIDKAQEIASQVKASGIYISPTLTVLQMIQDYRDDARFEKLKRRPETRYLAKSEYDNYTTEGKEYRTELFSSAKGISAVDTLMKNTQTLTKAFAIAGVPLLVGTDNIGLQIAGFSIHDEMAAMHDADVPTFTVLNGATQLAARYLKRQAVAGTISEGKKAEFILLSRNPLDDIRNTRSVEGVMIKGRWFDKKMLNGFLQDVENSRKAER